MLLSDLKNRNVAILGAGREGRSAWRRIRRLFPVMPLTVYAESAPAAEYADAFGTPQDRVIVGPLTAGRLARHEVLIRSPGISPYREPLRCAAQAGARITSPSTLWFAGQPAANTICITGTKGKSTTAALTAQLLKSAGVRVRLAGNIGEPLLDCDDRGVDWWVIELSSYQLADLVARPTVAALLNLAEAHLEWHGGLEAYHADKLRIAELASGKPLVANYADSLLRKTLKPRAGVIWFNRAGGFHVHGAAVRVGTSELVRLPLPGLRGGHDLANLAAALTVLQAAGADVPDVRQALQGFQGLPHRLQPLGTRHGCEWINDSLATTPGAVLAALQSCAGKPVTLLVGGQASDIDWADAIRQMRACCPHAIIGMPDNGPEIIESMRKHGLEPAAGMIRAGGLEEAVRHARALTPAGGAVLLSPGAPSFPRFRDYAERGARFAGLAGFESRDFDRNPE